MQLLIIWSLLTFGVTNIVVDSDIMFKVRNVFNRKRLSFIYEMITCPTCFSTWLGFLLSFTFLSFGFNTPISQVFSGSLILQVFLDGCLTSGIVTLIYKLK